MYVRMHACMYVCLYACMYVCMFVCIHIDARTPRRNAAEACTEADRHKVMHTFKTCLMYVCICLDGYEDALDTK